MLEGKFKGSKASNIFQNKILGRLFRNVLHANYSSHGSLIFYFYLVGIKKSAPLVPRGLSLLVKFY